MYPISNPFAPLSTSPSPETSPSLLATLSSSPASPPQPKKLNFDTPSSRSTPLKERQVKARSPDSASVLDDSALCQLAQVANEDELDKKKAEAIIWVATQVMGWSKNRKGRYEVEGQPVSIPTLEDETVRFFTQAYLNKNENAKIGEIGLKDAFEKAQDQQAVTYATIALGYELRPEISSQGSSSSENPPKMVWKKKGGGSSSQENAEDSYVPPKVEELQDGERVTLQRFRQAREAQLLAGDRPNKGRGGSKELDSGISEIEEIFSKRGLSRRAENVKSSLDSPSVPVLSHSVFGAPSQNAAVPLNPGGLNLAGGGKEDGGQQGQSGAVPASSNLPPNPGSIPTVVGQQSDGRGLQVNQDGGSNQGQDEGSSQIVSPEGGLPKRTSRRRRRSQSLESVFPQQGQDRSIWRAPSPAPLPPLGWRGDDRTGFGPWISFPCAFNIPPYNQPFYFSQGNGNGDWLSGLSNFSDVSDARLEIPYGKALERDDTSLTHQVVDGEVVPIQTDKDLMQGSEVSVYPYRQSYPLDSIDSTEFSPISYSCAFPLQVPKGTWSQIQTSPYATYSPLKQSLVASTQSSKPSTYSRSRVRGASSAPEGSDLSSLLPDISGVGSDLSLASRVPSPILSDGLESNRRLRRRRSSAPPSPPVSVNQAPRWYEKESVSLSGDQLKFVKKLNGSKGYGNSTRSKLFETVKAWNSLGVRHIKEASDWVRVIAHYRKGNTPSTPTSQDFDEALSILRQYLIPALERQGVFPGTDSARSAREALKYLKKAVRGGDITLIGPSDISKWANQIAQDIGASQKSG